MKPIAVNFCYLAIKPFDCINAQSTDTRHFHILSGISVFNYLFVFLLAKKECIYSKPLEKETLQEKWAPIVRLFKNKLFVANLVATVTSVFIASGFGTFAPKFFQVFLKTARFESFFFCFGIRWPLFFYSHHNLQS